MLKKTLRKIIVNNKIFERPAVSYCIQNEMLPTIFTGTSSKSLRKMFNLPEMDNETQLNQDLFALFLNRFRQGYFLEIGANDGFTFSNTVYLEKKFGWKGILVEANPKYLESLKLRSGAIVVNKAVAYHKGEADFIDAGLFGGLTSNLNDTHLQHTNNASKITVECMELQEILDLASAPDNIDFVSIDVEGGELPIVEQMVASRQRFKCGCIEYNGIVADYLAMEKMLNNANYSVIWKNQTWTDMFFVDNLTV